MVKRWMSYLQQMFPLHQNLPLSIVAFFATYYMAEAIIGKLNPRFEVNLLLGALTYSLFWLFLRVVDELKDYEIDKRLFRDRPLITGIVTIKDLERLALLIVFLMIVFNVFLAWINILYFIISLVYSLLMFKFFFYPKIQKSLILAVISHNPIILILQFYILSFIFLKYGYGVFDANIVLMMLMFWLPWLSWEIARKIRAPEQEDEYETYSQIFGIKGACTIVIIMSTIVIGLLWYLTMEFELSIIMSLASTVFYLYFIFRIILFLVNPVAKNAVLKRAAEIFLIGFYASVFIGLLAVAFIS